MKILLQRLNQNLSFISPFLSRHVLQLKNLKFFSILIVSSTFSDIVPPFVSGTEISMN